MCTGSYLKVSSMSSLGRWLSRTTVLRCSSFLCAMHSCSTAARELAVSSTYYNQELLVVLIEPGQMQVWSLAGAAARQLYPASTLDRCTSAAVWGLKHVATPRETASTSA